MSARKKHRLLRLIMIKTAAVRLGLKPAVLLRIKRHFLNGSGHEYSQLSGLIECGLSHHTLHSSTESHLILFYQAQTLNGLLQGTEIANFLKTFDYPTGIDSVLDHLYDRCQDTGIAHEVGIFLGYPLKDVKGFVLRHSPSVVQGVKTDWRIFGPVGESLSLMAYYRQIEQMSQALYDKHRQVESYLTNLVALRHKVSFCGTCSTPPLSNTRAGYPLIAVS